MIAEGWRFMTDHKVMATCTWAASTLNFVSGALLTLLPLYLVRTLDASPGAVGLLIATEGVGSLIGAAYTGRLIRRVGSARSVILATTAGGIFALAMPIGHATWGLVAFGVGNAGFASGTVVLSIASRTFRQIETPPHLLSQVMATVKSVSWGVIPIGALAAGVLADATGSRAALWVFCALTLIAPMRLLVSPVRGRRNLVSDPTDQPPILPGGDLVNTTVAGDFNYEAQGKGYGQQRRTDPRIAEYIHAALGDADTVLNVGAGAGSYEPTDRDVTAIEPSESMRCQRPAGSAPVIDGTAEHLPFADNTFDAAMATVTIHQWRDSDRGLRELRRVSRGPVVILTFDGDALDRFWLAEYVPELIAAERRRYPAIDHITAVLGGIIKVTTIPIPANCIDGFTEAYYNRPELFLDPSVREAQSAWGFVEPATIDRSITRLADDIRSGHWDSRHGLLRDAPEFLGSLRLVVATP